MTRVERTRATGRMAGAWASSHECRRAGPEPGERPEVEDSHPLVVWIDPGEPGRPLAECPVCKGGY